MLYKPAHEIILERTAHLIERRETQGRLLTREHVGAAIGYSAAAVSSFLSRKYTGDIDKLATLLAGFVDREEAKDAGGLLKLPFVETRPAKKLLDLITYCHTWSKMGLGYGWPGVGKTKAIEEATRRDHTLIVVTAWGNLSASGLVHELCDMVRVDFNGTQPALMKALRNKLSPKHGSLGRCIVVDDAHTLTFKALDVLRHVHDTTGTGLVLVGIPGLKHRIESKNQEIEQLRSRIASRLWEIPEFCLDDAALFFRAVMAERDAMKALTLLKDDPRSLTSGRWLGDLLEIAGKFASKRDDTMNLEDLQKAMKVAA